MSTFSGIWLLAWICVQITVSGFNFNGFVSFSNQKISCPRVNLLSMSASQTNNKAGYKGYYRRPSKAIESGGGFFIPGLEGNRIRIISSTIFLLSIFINHIDVIRADQTQAISELCGVSMSVLLFLQGIAPSISKFATVPQNDRKDVNLQAQNMKSLIITNRIETANTFESIVTEIACSSEGISYIGAFDNQGMLIQFGNEALFNKIPLVGESFGEFAKYVMNLQTALEPYVVYSFDRLRTDSSISRILGRAVTADIFLLSEPTPGYVDSTKGQWIFVSTMTTSGKSILWAIQRFKEEEDAKRDLTWISALLKFPPLLSL